MKDVSVTGLGTVSAAMLEQVVDALQGRAPQGLRVSVARPLGFRAVNAVTGGLYRFAGTVVGDGARQQWSCILKVARRPAGGDGQRPDSWCYWRREAEFYRSGWLQDPNSPLRAPRCLGVFEVAPHSQWIWLEELPGTNAPWSLAQHRLAAWHLGRWNGRWAGRAPGERWLSRHWFRDGLAGRHQWAEGLRQSEVWEHPLVHRAFPVPVLLRVLHLYQRAEELFEAMERWPPTLCHFDAYRPNFVAQGRRMVLMDWAFVGRGPVGTDVGQLLAGNFMWLIHRPRQFSSVERMLFSAYLRGLRSGGWRGSVEEVRLAHVGSAALRMAGYLPTLLSMLMEREQHDGWSRRMDGPLHRTLVPFGESTRALLGLADEAWGLLGKLSERPRRRPTPRGAGRGSAVRT